MTSKNWQTAFISPSKTKNILEWKRNSYPSQRFLFRTDVIPNTIATGSRLFLNAEDITSSASLPVSTFFSENSLGDYGSITSVTVLVLLLGLFGLSQLMNKTGFDEMDPVPTVAEDSNDVLLSSVEEISVSSDLTDIKEMILDDVEKIENSEELKTISENIEISNDAFIDTIEVKDISDETILKEDLEEIISKEKGSEVVTDEKAIEMQTESTIEEKIEISNDAFIDTIEVTDISDETVLKEDLEEIISEEKGSEVVTNEKAIEMQTESTIEAVKKIEPTSTLVVKSSTEEATGANLQELDAIKARKERKDVEELKKILRDQEKERKEIEQMQKVIPRMFQSIAEEEVVEVLEIKQVETNITKNEVDQSLRFFLRNKKIFFVAFLLVMGKRALSFAMSKAFI